MFRITRDPSSGSFIQCLAKITVMVLSCPLTWTWSVLWQHICLWCMCVLHCLFYNKSNCIYELYICCWTIKCFNRHWCMVQTWKFCRADLHCDNLYYWIWILQFQMCSQETHACTWCTAGNKQDSARDIMTREYIYIYIDTRWPIQI